LLEVSQGNCGTSWKWWLHHRHYITRRKQIYGIQYYHIYLYPPCILFCCM